MSGKNKYQAEMWHEGLNKYRVVSASSRRELQQKVASIEGQWNDQWERKLDIEARKELKQQEQEEKERERSERRKKEESSIEYAMEKTSFAQNIQKELDDMLINHLDPQLLDLDSQKDHSVFTEPFPEIQELLEMPREPLFSDEKYNQKPSLFVRLSKSRQDNHLAEQEAVFKKDHEAWEKECAAVEARNDSIIQTNSILVAQWEDEKKDFEDEREKRNRILDRLFEGFQSGEREYVEKYFSMLLEDIDLPLDYDREYEIEYNKETKTVIVDLFLPSLGEIPKLKSVAYIKSRQELKESFYSESYLKKKYDSVIYQMVLIVLNYLFTIGSKYSLVDMVVVNGRVHSVDNATGNPIEPYILSVSTTLSEFERINLPSVDPKAWFRSCKGISAATLSNVTPVLPLVAVSREDTRFVAGYGVAEKLSSSENLASMDWKDFENLVRELFEKEFSVNGGEVKITQASRDGGVDAVAFDPDPIRGGKIVIQAKRYTNVVGVSAVRDLYGTVMNEGATKGILVTTSYYGNDAYSFAQGKPLTLLNGANLLYLLEKHGYKARIDITETNRQ